MRQPARILLAMFVLTSVSALADSFTNLNVNFIINPNSGSGGNLGGTISGPGVNLTVGGGTDNTFYLISGFAPGSLGEGGTNIFWDLAFGQINGQVFSSAGSYPVDLLLSNPALTARLLHISDERQRFHHHNSRVVGLDNWNYSHNVSE